MPSCQVISQSFQVNAPGQTRHFSLRLPHHATHIIGVEYGVRLISDVPAAAPAAISFEQTFTQAVGRQLGLLRLAHPGCHGLFYACPVMEQDFSCILADFSFQAGFTPAPYSHGHNRFEDPISISKRSAMVSGIYMDTFNQANGLSVTYQVTIYLWYDTLSAS